jgi:hypothetical protein
MKQNSQYFSNLTKNRHHPGYPSQFTRKRVKGLLSSVRNGISLFRAARQSGITTMTVSRWIKRYPAFETALARARTAGKQARRKGLHKIFRPEHDTKKNASDNGQNTEWSQDGHFRIKDSFGQLMQPDQVVSQREQADIVNLREAVLNGRKPLKAWRKTQNAVTERLCKLRGITVEDYQARQTLPEAQKDRASSSAPDSLSVTTVAVGDRGKTENGSVEVAGSESKPFLGDSRKSKEDDKVIGFSPPDNLLSFKTLPLTSDKTLM